MRPATHALFLWRHPKPRGAVGRCIGHTDLSVDPRKAKRLAHRIRRHARRLDLPREVCTSPLRRGADVGRWLARWGWTHRIDEALIEFDFGAWDGRMWCAIGPGPLDAWNDDFADYAGHGGESVTALFARCAAWLADAPTRRSRCVVGHAGWMQAAQMVHAGALPPRCASAWPPPPSYGDRFVLG